jgi:hypothetical protein
MPARLLVRSASNAYYSQTLSVIHIPDHNAAVVDAVDKVWDDFLQYVETPGDLANEKKKAKVAAALEGLDEAAVMQDIERRKGNLGPTTKNLKSIEFETICRAPKELSEDVPDADFYAREFTPAYAPVWFKEKIDRVVLVHRLREVRALLGFTRLDPVAPDLDGELNLPELRRAALALDTKWLPAVETRGEGFFMSFNSQALSAWVSRPGVQSRLSDLQRGFAAWATRQGFKDMKAPGPRLTLLHSLSHLLITSISLEAGYSASSIRERIYVGDTGAGILLYTGSSDSEGTLGGLVDVGRRIGQHLEQALELGRLCSNDPVCADHAPDNNAEERYLHGASCHGCLLIAEPSCELRNEFLDRALVVPTVGTPDAAFFEDAGAL